MLIVFTVRSQQVLTWMYWEQKHKNKFYNSLVLAQAEAGPQSQSKKQWDKNLASEVHYILMSPLNNHLQ